MTSADRGIFAVSALVFAASAAVTVAWCASMTVEYCITSPGASTISMAWRPTPDQSWFGAAVSFLAMWVVMMVAMMLPALVPMLRRYREAIGGTRPGLGALTAIVGAGYFCVWAAIGAAAFPVGAWLTQIRFEVPALQRATPLAVGVVVLLAGVFQFSAWKARRLARCRMPVAQLPAGAGAALRHGLGIGVECGLSCANLTVVLFALGVMDLRTMAAVMAAITSERLAPAHTHAASIAGAALIVTGVLLIVQAALPG